MAQSRPKQWPLLWRGRLVPLLCTQTLSGGDAEQKQTPAWPQEQETPACWDLWFQLRLAWPLLARRCCLSSLENPGFIARVGREGALGIPDCNDRELELDGRPWPLTVCSQPRQHPRTLLLTSPMAGACCSVAVIAHPQALPRHDSSRRDTGQAGPPGSGTSPPVEHWLLFMHSAMLHEELAHSRTGATRHTASTESEGPVS